MPVLANVGNSQSGGSGTGGPGGSTVWVAGGSVASSAYASGLGYSLLRNAQSDTIAFQFVAPSTGNVSVRIIYAMSSAESSNVRLRFDVLTLGDGESPTGSQTTGTPFTITPGNDTNRHTLTSASSSDMQVAVTADDVVFCTLTRLGSDGADTHAGDMRVIEIRVA